MAITAKGAISSAQRYTIIRHKEPKSRKKILIPLKIKTSWVIMKMPMSKIAVVVDDNCHVTTAVNSAHVNSPASRCVDL